MQSQETKQPPQQLEPIFDTTNPKGQKTHSITSIKVEGVLLQKPTGRIYFRRERGRRHLLVSPPQHNLILLGRDRNLIGIDLTAPSGRRFVGLNEGTIWNINQSKRGIIMQYLFNTPLLSFLDLKCSNGIVDWDVFY